MVFLGAVLFSWRFRKPLSMLKMQVSVFFSCSSYLYLIHLHVPLVRSLYFSMHVSYLPSYSILCRGIRRTKGKPILQTPRTSNMQLGSIQSRKSRSKNRPKHILPLQRIRHIPLFPHCHTHHRMVQALANLWRMRHYRFQV